MSGATVRLEKELDKLQNLIDKDPNDDEMVSLANKIKSDHDKVQHALNYAEMPEKDKNKLKRLITDTAG